MEDRKFNPNFESGNGRHSSLDGIRRVIVVPADCNSERDFELYLAAVKQAEQVENEKNKKLNSPWPRPVETDEYATETI